MVVPGSQQVKAQAEAEGLDRVFREAGFDWRVAGCSMCLGMNPDIARPGGAVRLDVEPQLRGPPGPRRAHAPGVSADGGRGRHRGAVHGYKELELKMEPIETISGAVSHLDRANVDTDQIMPKQFLKRVERSGFGEFLFYDWAKEPGWDLPANPILVAGENFGCGSSREHAPWGLQDYGFQTLVAPSFADIFYSNCTKIGLLPVVLAEEHCRALAAAGEGQVDLRAQEVRYPDPRDPDGEPVRVPFEIDPETRRRLLEGLDDIAVTLGEAQRIAAYEEAHEGRSEPTHPLVGALDTTAL